MTRPSSCSRTSPISSRACRTACRSRFPATRTAARCACSAIRRWCPRASATAYAYGHIVEDNRHLIVSGGLGCSILPVRIGVPPEIVMVDVAA